jgi:hypothetical protein
MATFYKDDNKVLVRDLNRYRKVYRYIRKKPKPLKCKGDEISHFQWGTYFVDFVNQTSVTHYFPCCYSSPPIVIATSVETSGSTGNLNVFVSEISANHAVFETSALYTGRVHYQALKTGVYTMPNIGKNLEVVELTFNSTNTKTYNWDPATGFTCVPIVTATASEDVNVFISAVSASSVTVEVSDPNYSGKVYLIGIERGC